MPGIHALDPSSTNVEIFERHAAPGLIGLVGGTAFPDRTIRRMQRSLHPERADCLWSHAFLCTGKRVDGHHWVLESDLEFHRKQIRLGVQENRAEKYFKAEEYPNVALLDFGLHADQVRILLTEGLDLVAGVTRYSLRELVGTLIAMHRPALRSRDNLLARERSLYCSALVQHCYTRAGIELAPGVALKNTTPQDLATTVVPHTAYVLVREGATASSG